MLRPLFGDFESRSKAKLDDVGGRIYAQHPTTEVLCCSFEFPDRSRYTWSPFKRGEVSTSRMGRELGILLAFGHPVAFHNAIGFDRHIWRKLGWPEPKRWVDTAELARVAGMPKADLDWLLTTLLGRRKDLEGNKLVKKLSVASRARARMGLLPEVTPEILRRVIEYCEDDLSGLVQLWDEHLSEWIDLDVPGYEDVQRALNERGIGWDSKLARTLLVADEVLCEQAIERLRKQDRSYSRALVGSPQKLRAELQRLGIDAPDCKKETIETILEEKPSKTVRLLCEARQATSSIAAGKLRAGLLRVSRDGRLRDSLRYYGAHTGREAGSGVQLQNLPKGPALELQETIAALYHGELRMLVSAKGKPGDPGYKPAEWKDLDASGVCSLLRACLIAAHGHTFAVSDWSQIEGRVLAWAADDRDALARFRKYDAGDKNADPYKVLAAIIYAIRAAEVSKEQRQVGKVGELGCGYQMGAKRFHSHAVKNGVDWDALFPLNAADVVKAWRALHEPIVGFWYEMQEAAIEVTGARGNREVEVGPFLWVKHDGLVMNVLPSNRVIVYQGMALTHSVDDWGRKRIGLKYSSRKGSEHTYGGKLTENAVQATAGDLMREGLVKADAAGLNPLLTIHDELICEVEKRGAKEALKRLEGIMCELPRWARGLPIAAEGFLSDRYRKG